MAVGLLGEQVMKKKRIPIGYRFEPNDVELTTIYLWNKLHDIPIPGLAIPDLDLDVALFYAMSPSFLAEYYKEERRKRRWSAEASYFFLRKNKGIDARRDCERYVGKENVHQGFIHERNVGKDNGHWKFMQKHPIYKKNGHEVAIKLKSVYMNENGEKTCWNMEEYRLSNKSSENQNQNQWVLVKINSGYVKDDHIESV